MRNKLFLKEPDRLFKSLFIALFGLFSALIFVAGIYFFVAGKLTLISLIFLSLLYFFMVFLPAIGAFRMPFSVGSFFLLMGSGFLLFSKGLASNARGKDYLFLTSAVFLAMGLLLLLSKFLEKKDGNA